MKTASPSFGSQGAGAPSSWALAQGRGGGKGHTGGESETGRNPHSHETRLPSPWKL